MSASIDLFAVLGVSVESTSYKVEVVEGDGVIGRSCLLCLSIIQSRANILDTSFHSFVLTTK